MFDAEELQAFLAQHYIASGPFRFRYTADSLRWALPVPTYVSARSEAGELIGTLAGSVSGRTLYVNFLCVHSDLRGRGLARRLIQRLGDACPSRAVYTRGSDQGSVRYCHFPLDVPYLRRIGFVAEDSDVPCLPPRPDGYRLLELRDLPWVAELLRQRWAPDCAVRPMFTVDFVKHILYDHPETVETWVRTESECNSDGRVLPAVAESECNSDGRVLPAVAESECNSDGRVLPAVAESECNSDGRVLPAVAESECNSDGRVLPAVAESECNSDGRGSDKTTEVVSYYMIDGTVEGEPRPLRQAYLYYWAAAEGRTTIAPQKRLESDARERQIALVLHAAGARGCQVVTALDQWQAADGASLIRHGFRPGTGGVDYYLVTPGQAIKAAPETMGVILP